VTTHHEFAGYVAPEIAHREWLLGQPRPTAPVEVAATVAAAETARPRWSFVLFSSATAVLLVAGAAYGVSTSLVPPPSSAPIATSPAPPRAFGRELPTLPLPAPSTTPPGVPTVEDDPNGDTDDRPPAPEQPAAPAPVVPDPQPPAPEPSPSETSPEPEPEPSPSETEPPPEEPTLCWILGDLLPCAEP